MATRAHYNEDHPVISFRITQRELDMLRMEGLRHGYHEIAPYMRHLIREERERINGNVITRIKHM